MPDGSRGDENYRENMKRNKMTRITCLVLSLLMLLGMTSTAFATYSTRNIPLGEETRNTVQNISEYSMILSLKEMDEDTLLAEGYTNNQIDIIKSEKTDKLIISELMERAKLSDDILTQKGYAESEIEELRSLTGDESITEIYGLFASVTVSNSKVLYYYDSDDILTYFIINVSWEWDKEPVVHFTDIVAAGWSGNYQLTNNTSIFHNELTLNCVGNGYPIAPKIATVNMTSSDINAGKASFSMDQGGYPGDHDYTYWVKSGYGNIELSIVGLDQNAEFIFKYGHSTLTMSPSISIGGLSLSFSSGIDTFTPASGAVYGRAPEVYSKRNLH